MLKTPIADMLGIHKQENLLPHTQYLITADHCSFPAVLQSLSLIISKVYVSLLNVPIRSFPSPLLVVPSENKVSKPRLLCFILALSALILTDYCMRAFVEHANMNLLSGTEI